MLTVLERLGLSDGAERVITARDVVCEKRLRVNKRVRRARSR
jgi:hypothetical protein